jgi:hypothetical protein
MVTNLTNEPQLERDKYLQSISIEDLGEHSEESSIVGITN